MDPDALLDELVELGFQLAETSDREHAEELLEEIVQKATEPRSWLERGGFPPNQTPNGKVRLTCRMKSSQ